MKLKYLLTITSIVILGVAFLFGVFGHITAMIVAALASMAFLIAANLDRITEFRASKSGFEAKTRDVIEKAESTVTELQILAKEIGRLTLSLVKRSGRWGAYEFDEEESIRTSLLTALKKVGIPDTDIPDLLSEWHKFDDFDYAHAILGNGRVPRDISAEFIEEWQLLCKGGLSNIPTPQTIRDFLNRSGLMVPELEERVKDYEYFREHKKHRRPDAWRDHLKWELMRKLPEN